MFTSLPLLDGSGVWLDERSYSDLVSVPHSGMSEWAGVAGPADAESRDAVGAPGQLFSLDGRL